MSHFCFVIFFFLLFFQEQNGLDCHFFLFFRLALYSHPIVPGIGMGDGEVNVQGKCFPLFFFFFHRFLSQLAPTRILTARLSMRLYALPQKTREFQIRHCIPRLANHFSRFESEKRERNKHIFHFFFCPNQ